MWVRQGTTVSIKYDYSNVYDIHDRRVYKTLSCTFLQTANRVRGTINDKFMNNFIFPHHVSEAFDYLFNISR